MRDKVSKRRPVVSERKKGVIVASSSDDDGDSDVEKNFALFSQKRVKSQELIKSNPGSKKVRFEMREEFDIEDKSEDEQHVIEPAEDAKEKGESSQDLHKTSSNEEESTSEEDDDEDAEEEKAGGSSREIQTKEDIRRELSNMSFEDVLKLQNKVGTKFFREIAYDSNTSKRFSKKKKRLNKNRPAEMSAKKRAPFLRQVVPVKKPVARDPRFDDLSGEYKPEIFEQTYKFINDIKRKEKEVVKKKLKKTKSNKTKEKLQSLLKRFENQEREREIREKQRERELQFKREQRERAGQGAHPFFLKKSDKKKIQLAEKYQELKKSGKLDKFLSKKRKRNAGKDRRRLPSELQGKKAA